MKRCSICRVDLPAAAFAPDGRHSTGLRSECVECGRTRSRLAMRQRYAEFPDRVAEQYARSYAKCRDRRLAGMRAYHAAHREEANAAARAYHAANRDKLRTPMLDRVRARRARLAGVHVEEVSRIAVFERDGWVCWLCGAPVDPAATGGMRPSVDHVVPISCGGPHSMDNVRLAHLGCNQGRPRTG